MEFSMEFFYWRTLIRCFQFNNLIFSAFKTLWPSVEDFPGLETGPGSLFNVQDSSNGHIDVEDFPDLEMHPGSLFSFQDSSNGHVEDSTDFETRSGSLFSVQNSSNGQYGVIIWIVFDAQASLKIQKVALLVVLRGAFLGGISTLLFNKFWYFLKMKVSFLLHWFFKQSKRVLFLPFCHFLLICLKKIGG